MIDCRRAPGFLDVSVVVSRLNLDQPCGKAGFECQLRSPRMVGMAIRYRVGQNNLRTEFADCPHNKEALLGSIAEKSIFQTQVDPCRQTQDLCRSCCLRAADLRRTTGAEFSPREIDNTHLVAHRHMTGDRSTASEFGIIRMGGKFENVQLHEREKSDA